MQGRRAPAEPLPSPGPSYCCLTHSKRPCCQQDLGAPSSRKPSQPPEACRHWCCVGVCSSLSTSFWLFAHVRCALGEATGTGQPWHGPALCKYLLSGRAKRRWFTRKDITVGGQWGLTLILSGLTVAQSHKLSMVLCGPKGRSHMVTGLAWLKSLPLTPFGFRLCLVCTRGA